MTGIETAVDHVEDDVLRLMFICCHPALGDDAQRTLTLRLVAGLTTSEIARSFLTSEATIGARITRAKKTLAEVEAPTEEPADNERAERLGRRARGDLPAVQRGLLRHGGRGLDASCAQRGGRTPGPSARRARAGRP